MIETITNSGANIPPIVSNIEIQLIALGLSSTQLPTEWANFLSPFYRLRIILLFISLEFNLSQM